MPKISLCMVVRDEARTLAGAVQSVLPVVDEVVIGADEASTDETPAIARELASPGRYFTFGFEDNFSAIRNAAIERASGDMILILDGHEFIAPNDHPVCPTMARMRRLDPESQVPTPLTTLAWIKEHGLPGETVVCCVTTCMNTDPGGVPQLFFLQPRLFVHHIGIHYENEVHNALAGYKREQTCAYRDALLVHNMPADREEKRKVQRKAMNASGLFADVRAEYEREKRYREEHGEEMPLALRRGRPFFYMGNTYADQGDYEKAMYWYRQYVPRSGFGDEKYQALQQLAVMTYRSTKDTAKAFEYLNQAEWLCYNRAEPACLKAEICMSNGDWTQAIHWLNVAEQYPAPDTVMFLQGPVYSYLPAFQRAKCYMELKDWQHAIGELEEVLTWRPGDPDVVKGIVECRNHLRRETSKPNMLFVDRIGSFTGELAQHYADMNWAVVRREACDPRWQGWSDIAWFEWADANIAEWSQREWQCPVVCRLHSYEAYTDILNRVRWENVSHLVFVADHIRRLVFERFPEIPKSVEHSVIHNGVNPDKYRWRKHGHGRKIAFLGYINAKKSPDGLVTLARMYPDYEFHIAGQPQELNIWDDFRFQIADLHNVWFHGWVTNQDAWLEDMDYLVSPSVIESFGFTIAEAALKGIKPLVRHRIGASELWPEQWIYRGPEDLLRVLNSEYDAEFNRQWILDRYTLKRQLELTDALVQRLLGGSRRITSDKWRGHVITNCLEVVGDNSSGVRSLSMAAEPARVLDT